MAFESIRKLFNKEGTAGVSPNDMLSGIPSEILFQDQDQERLEEDLRIVSEDTKVERSQKTAEKEVRTAAEHSLKRMHILQRGRCPQCGAALRQHLFASVCDSCGWSSWSTPRVGGVKVHLVEGGDPILGDAVYVVKDGVTILIRGETVFARFPPHAVLWVEYIWTEAELKDRERALRERMVVACAWCGKDTDSESDGFHLVQVAFGMTQERYCFCCDDCYEAFRKMFPSRVHRNCYERDCETCDLCMKRYRSESSGMRTMPKDFLTAKDRN